MFFKSKPKIEISVSADELLRLHDRLNLMIEEWVIVESSSGLVVGSKLTELIIFNMKLIYNKDTYNDEMLKFMESKVDGSGDTDLLFSRIQDLYVNIMLCFPTQFIESIARKHFDTLTDLGYDTDIDIFYQIPFAWLMARIQDVVRFRIKPKTN